MQGAVRRFRAPTTRPEALAAVLLGCVVAVHVVIPARPEVGADALAGSKPSHRSTKGSIEPASVPQRTTPIRLADTAVAIST